MVTNDARNNGSLLANFVFNVLYCDIGLLRDQFDAVEMTNKLMLLKMLLRCLVRYGSFTQQI